MAGRDSRTSTFISLSLWERGGVIGANHDSAGTLRPTVRSGVSPQRAQGPQRPEGKGFGSGSEPFLPFRLCELRALCGEIPALFLESRPVILRVT
jgi:hypothetical protein